MDSSDITKLLESQEKAYRGAMEVMVKHLTERIQSLESTVSSLTASLEFSQREIDELKNAMKDNDKEKSEYRKTIDTLTHHTESLQQQIKSIEERVNQQEDFSRRNNIRISGVAEPNSEETFEQTAVMVSSLLADKLELPGVGLERAHRVGQRRDGRPRPIVARFSRYCDREAAMRNARKLRGTNIYFNDDLCAASQSVKNAQMPQLKQARAEGKIAYFRHTKLIVKDRLVAQKPSVTQTSVNETSSTPDRDQQQNGGVSTRHDRQSLSVTGETVGEGGAAMCDAGAPGGDELGGTSVVRTSRAARDFPPLPPLNGRVGLRTEQASPHSQALGAASLLHPEEMRKYPRRNTKKK